MHHRTTATEPSPFAAAQSSAESSALAAGLADRAVQTITAAVVQPAAVVIIATAPFVVVAVVELRAAAAAVAAAPHVHLAEVAVAYSLQQVDLWEEPLAAPEVRLAVAAPLPLVEPRLKPTQAQ